MVIEKHKKNWLINAGLLASFVAKRLALREATRTIQPAVRAALVAGSAIHTTVPINLAYANAIAGANPCPKRKQCAAPGHCQHYVDNNRNGWCDPGECL